MSISVVKDATGKPKFKMPPIPGKRVDPTKPVPKDWRPQTPLDLNVPAYLMNFPFSYDTKNANNVFMKDIPPEKRKVDHDKANAEYLMLQRKLNSEGYVWTLPADMRCQDQIFVANLGIVLTHLEEPTFVLARFKSPPRVPEEDYGREFFRMMGYKVEQPDDCFEGEAELKSLHSNVYAGGYGIRSDIGAYQWMEKKFSMKVIPLHMTDEKLYHLDCQVFPLTLQKTLVCTKAFEPSEIKALEKETEIIDVPLKLSHLGVTNSVRLNNSILMDSCLPTKTKKDKDYMDERERVDFMLDICIANEMELCCVNLDEFAKGGAELSCCILHLNRASYAMPLI